MGEQNFSFSREVDVNFFLLFRGGETGDDVNFS